MGTPYKEDLGETTETKKSCATLPVQGHWHEKCFLWVFSSKHLPSPPVFISEYYLKSPSYSNSKPSCDVVTPLVWSFFPARVDPKQECYSPWLLMFHHAHISHRLPLGMQLHALKEYLNIPGWKGRHRRVKSLRGGGGVKKLLKKTTGNQIGMKTI